MASASKRRNAPTQGRGKTDNAGSVADLRFANLSTDPRYRRQSRKQGHVEIDKRFASMLRDDDFSAKARVDRYGRKIPKGSGKKKLESLYRVVNDDEEGEEDDAPDEIPDDDQIREELARLEKKFDPAREGGYSESSSSESEESSGSSSEDEEEDLDVEPGVQDESGRERGEDVPMGDVTSRIAVVNLDWDNVRAADIMAVAQSFAPGEGVILDVTVYPSEFGKEQMELEEIEGPPKELFKSKKTNNSERPLHHHRSKAGSRSASDNASQSDDDDEDRIQKELMAHASAPEPEIDSKALRNYQLTRLRYFYAVITCSSASAAHKVYSEMDGREYLSSANFFDLRFVPDDVDFDEKPREVCKRLPDGYRPQEFVTEALTHSKVRLTWDEDDQGRKDVQKRAFAAQAKGKGSGQTAEPDDDDLRAYIGSDSDSSGGGEQEDVEIVDSRLPVISKAGKRKLNKSDEARRKMREALGLSLDDDHTPSEPNSTASKKTSKTPSTTAAPSGNMQITFSSGLSSDPSKPAASVFQNTPADAHEETTREKYIRKEKERKARRKAKRKGLTDETEEGASASSSHAQTAGSRAEHDAENRKDASADPFDDPFFEDPSATNAATRKAAKRAQRVAESAEAAAAAQTQAKERAQLQLLVDDDNGAGAAGFDMTAIRKAEKEAARKGRKGRRKAKEEEQRAAADGAAAAKSGGGDGFELDVADPRFSGVFEDHEFAIDPSNPRFSGTREMKRLLEEGRKKRRARDEVDEDVGAAKSAGKEKRKERRLADRDAAPDADGGDVDDLLRKIKRRKGAA